MVEKAWSEFKALRDCRLTHDYAPLLYRRTKSNHIFDAIARYAFEEFGADPEFMLKAQSQTFKIFHSGCCIRFKKGGSNLLGNNVSTQAVMDFIQAEGQLPGLPPDTAKLEIIWVANELFTDLDAIHIVSRDGNKLVWEYPINRPDDGTVLPLPPTTIDPDHDNGEDLIKPKEDSRESTAKQD